MSKNERDKAALCICVSSSMIVDRRRTRQLLPFLREAKEQLKNSKKELNKNGKTNNCVTVVHLYALKFFVYVNQQVQEMQENPVATLDTTFSAIGYNIIRQLELCSIGFVVWKRSTMFVATISSEQCATTRLAHGPPPYYASHVSVHYTLYAARSSGSVQIQE